MFDTEEKVERLILVAASTDDSDVQASLDELEELVNTAGGVVVGRIVQNRERVDRATYIGKGKIEEVRELIDMENADGIVCDDELSPAQQANLSDILNTKVMDRTLVILDIFAKRAITGEGKIQVELAQLKYRSTRLTGMGKVLSRLGGGIGTRGPGEKKLEIDRRLIRKRIAILRQEIEDMETHRDLVRRNRDKTPLINVAIVGYTNAGKSTLLNTLTQAGILEEDKLFATLDPTTREYKLSSGQKILLTDTVGFIKKLPHNLIDAFRSTLEEAAYADILIHMVDASNPQADLQMQTVYETLDMLGAGDKPVITVFNKQDKLESESILKDLRAEYTVKCSVKKKQGLDDLMECLEDIIRQRRRYISKVFSYSETGKLQNIRKYGELLTEEYREDGIYIEAYVPTQYLQDGGSHHE